MCEAEGRALSAEINSKDAKRRAAEVKHHTSKQRRKEEHAAGTRKEEECAAAKAAAVLLTLVCAKAELAEAHSSQAKSCAGDPQTNLQATKQELGSTIERLLDCERERESAEEHHAAEISSYEKEKALTATKLESANKEIKV